MNLNFRDKNLFVRYIQAFLHKYYSTNIIINGEYDIKTHIALKEYLNIPVSLSRNDFLYNITDDDINSLVIEKLGIRIDGSEDKINPFDYWFKYDNHGLNKIKFTSKSISENNELVTWVIENMQNIEDLVYELGWKLSEVNTIEPPYSLTFEVNGYGYPFPRDEVKCLVNMFEGKYYYDKYIDDRDTIQYNKDLDTKICAIECKPETTYTIYHDQNTDIEMKIGSSISSLINNAINNFDTIYNTESFTLAPNTPKVYKTSKGASFLIIQVPSSGINDLGLEVSDAKSDNVNSLLVFEGFYDIDEENSEEIVDKSYWIPDNFSESPWIVHEKFLEYICNRTIDTSSNPEDIAKVQRLINSMYNSGSLGAFTDYPYFEYTPGEYDHILRNIIKDIQNKVNISYDNKINKKIYYSLGFIDRETESILISLADGEGEIFV